MLKLLKNRAGTAEIVGTVLFLVILFFFFSNVFLWHNQVTQEMERVTADKMNSPVRIETVVGVGDPVHVENRADELIYPGFGDPSPPEYKPESTRYLDGDCRTIREKTAGDYLNVLTVDYTFRTGIAPRQRMELVSALQVCIRASYLDDEIPPEICHIRVYNVSDGQWFTVRNFTGAFRWLNVTLSQPSNFMDSAGLVKIRFQDDSSTTRMDKYPGELDIDYMEVAAEQVVLEVTDLGGVDVSLSRLWMLNSTQTEHPENDHMYADLERNLWISGGSHRDIQFNMTISNTEFADGAVKVVINDGRIVVNYVPASGQTVIFRVVTKLGNTAACSLDFS
jgi:hypothetical protein